MMSEGLSASDVAVLTGNTNNRGLFFCSACSAGEASAEAGVEMVVDLIHLPRMVL